MQKGSAPAEQEAFKGSIQQEAGPQNIVYGACEKLDRLIQRSNELGYLGESQKLVIAILQMAQNEKNAQASYWP